MSRFNPLDTGRPFGADSPELAKPIPCPIAEREMARESTILAIANWRAARARVEAIRAAGKDADPSNKWQALAIDAQIDAEETLILAILSHDPGFRDFDHWHALKQHRPARGVAHDGFLYLAVADPDHDEGGPEDNIDVMKLVVMKIDLVVEFEGGPIDG